MIITRLQELEKSRVKVILDDEITFILSQKDMEQYDLREEAFLSDSVYSEIAWNILYPRAQQKALSILKFSDRTEKELRDKLAQAEYPNEITDRVLTYVKAYGYLNEERFAGTYIRARMNRKSKLLIKNELLQKGIDRNILDQVLQEEYSMEEGGKPSEDPELTAIRKAIDKKTKDPGKLTYEEKQKLIASLYRKGFNLGKINQIL